MLSRLLTVREQIILAAIPLVVVLGAVVLVMQGGEDGENTAPVVIAPVPASESATTSPEPAEQPPKALQPSVVEEDPTEEPKRVGVAIRGAVSKPGLYYLDEGKRVDDLLREAGGVSENADMTDINISAYLQDATTLTIPQRHVNTGPSFSNRRPPRVINPPEYTISGWTSDRAVPAGSHGAGPATAPARATINVNTASANELEQLPGIGPVLAQRIVAARSEAPFASIEDLTRVRGIGTKTVEDLRSHVRVR